VASTGQDHGRRCGALRVQCPADTEWGSHVCVAVEQQGRRLDARQHVAEVGLGQGVEHHPAARRASVAHKDKDAVGHLLGAASVSSPGRYACPFRRRPREFAQESPEALLGNVGGQRPGPSGVGAGEHKRPRDVGTSAVELDGQRRPHEADDMRPVQAERRDEPGEAAGLLGHAEVSRRVGRPAHPGRVPRHHGELVSERRKLRPPRPAVEPEAAVLQNTGRTRAGPLQSTRRPATPSSSTRRRLRTPLSRFCRQPRRGSPGR
jgi:hypothetical protein